MTGTRAEFGLLRPVMRAIAAHPQLELNVLAAGGHLLPPQNTIEEVRSQFAISATIAMQSVNQDGRIADAESLGRGITGFAEVFAQERPEVVLVLGDRIEAFAAATAASVAGIRVAHMHGGDRAEGIADEAIRHAITKLSHIHLPATQNSALRIIAMGEDPARVHIVGSPAIDGLSDFAAIGEDDFTALGRPEIIVLLHPCGDPDDQEYERAAELLRMTGRAGPTLALHPNHDAGHHGILRAIHERAHPGPTQWAGGADGSASSSPCATPADSSSRIISCAHLPREKFIGLLRRGKALIGNSSAGLIECAAVPIRAINIGPRQAGREMPANVTNIPQWDYQTIRTALDNALQSPPLHSVDVSHPYGQGRAGEQTADLLARLDLIVHSIGKRNSY